LAPLPPPLVEVPPPPELPQPVAAIASAATSPPATVTPLIRLANIISKVSSLGLKLERLMPRAAQGNKVV
jgi:hypothetical protein